MSGTVEHGIDRSGSPAAVATAAAAASAGAATGAGAVISAPSGGVTDNAIVRWDGTTGLLVQNSTGILSDAGALSGITTISASGVITSTVTTGTAPLTIASTTAVTNLNADLLDGEHGSYYTGYADTAQADAEATAAAALSNHVAAADPHAGYVLESALTTNGDIYYRAAGAITRLGIGSSNQVLTVSPTTLLPVWDTGGSGSGAGASTDVTQTAHGFVAGNLVRILSNNVYTKAQANSAANAEVAGIVSEVASSNSFTLLYIGAVSGLSGLTAGTVYFLDPSTAGAMTATEPSTVGQISKPVFVATSTTAGIFFNYRGTVVGSATSTLLVQRFSGNGSTVDFPLNTQPNENNTFVYVSGVYQQKDTYSISGTTLTFSGAPPSGTDNIEVVTVGTVAVGSASSTEAGATLTLGTEQATTSGTAIDFTGIPAGTKMIVVNGHDISTNGTGQIALQLGDSGGVETTGYDGALTFLSNSAPGGLVHVTTDIRLTAVGQTASEEIHSFTVNLWLEDAAAFTWHYTMHVSVTVGGVEYLAFGRGFKSLSAELDRVRITGDGTDTFDAGSINIAYK